MNEFGLDYQGLKDMGFDDWREGKVKIPKPIVRKIMKACEKLFKVMQHTVFNHKSVFMDFVSNCYQS